MGLHSQGIALLATLMLRGPQTPGELRGRASRMASIASLGELDNLLNSDSQRRQGFMVDCDFIDVAVAHLRLWRGKNMVSTQQQIPGLLILKFH